MRATLDGMQPPDASAETGLPAVRCELPIREVRLVNHASAGVFALVDDRLDQDTAKAMLGLLEVGLVLDPDTAGPVVTWPTGQVGLSAWAVRARAVAAATRLTREAGGIRPLALPLQGRVTMSDRGDTPPPNLRTDRAHPARVYDYLLNGKTNYPPDRDAAEATLEALPSSRSVAWGQREFMHRTAAAVVAEFGVTQFLDLGTGIPTEPNLHQVVQAIEPTARVVYVDNDPIVLTHASVLMISDPRGQTAYLQADVRDPAFIVESVMAGDVLDLACPVAVSIIGLLHFLDDDTVEGLLATLRGVMVSGSVLTINHTTLDTDDSGAVQAACDAYTAAGMSMFPRTRTQVAALMDGLDVLEPGVVSPLVWRPVETRFPAAHHDQSQWGAVARIP